MVIATSIVGGVVLLALIIILIARRDASVRAVRVGIFYEKERDLRFAPRRSVEDTSLDLSEEPTTIRRPL